MNLSVRGWVNMRINTNNSCEDAPFFVIEGERPEEDYETRRREQKEAFLKEDRRKLYEELMAEFEGK